MALVRLIRNIVAQIGGILIVIIMLILLVKKIAYSKCEFEKKSVKCESWLEIAKTYQLCIERGIKTVRSGSLWNKLHLVVDMCKKLATLPLNVTYLANADDIKGLVGEERKKMRGKIEENSQLLPDFVKKNDSLNCSVVTLGVGNDINVEKEILLRLPGCKLYGADPVLASGQIYSSVGKFFNLAVGADSGNRMAIVLRNSTYKKENVAHVGLVDFLTKFVKITTVDLMILDVEGTEYEILPLLSQGGQLDAAGISLCQISAELHGPIDQYGLNMSSWETLVRNFLLKSDFIPLWTPEPYNHHRMFLINWKNPICITKFYSNLC